MHHYENFTNAQMKIIMLYTPRSRSTWTHHVLVKKFHLDNTWCEPLLESRRPRQDYEEYPEIINRINHADNCCIKISCNDWIDTNTKKLRADYQNIKWNRFDRVITHTRKDFVSAILSYAYMDMRDKKTWHRRQGELKLEQPYHVPVNIMYYLLRGYAMFDLLEKHIIDTVDSHKLHRYEFSTVERQISEDFGLQGNDLVAEIADNNLPYHTLATNYSEILTEAPKVLTFLKQQITDPTDLFWKNSNIIL